MTTITATIVADSVGMGGIYNRKRITSILLRYPKYIHAEGRTHRVIYMGEEIDWVTESLMKDPNLSRNASSSRAIPVSRMIDDVLRDPVIPQYWGRNQPGMSASEQHSEPVEIPSMAALGQTVKVSPEQAWLWGRDQAIILARAYAAAGYHKQHVNRALEPYAHINTLVTATEWDNFFLLRDHDKAQPEIRTLAREMQDAIAWSSPTPLAPGQWHLPFVRPEDYETAGVRIEDTLETNRVGLSRLLKVSVARCARLSYRTFEGRPSTLEEDEGLYGKLVVEDPLHASPAEHQATPQDPFDRARVSKTGNFVDWIQLRKLIERKEFGTFGVG